MCDMYTKFKEKYPDLILDENDNQFISFGCGMGWGDIIDTMLKRLQPHGVKIIQLKEKFGYLRVYLNKDNKETDEIVRIAELDSSKTCEYCGSTEGVSTEGSWLKTLCRHCRQVKNKP